MVSQQWVMGMTTSTPQFRGGVAAERLHLVTAVHTVLHASAHSNPLQTVSFSDIFSIVEIKSRSE